METWERDYLKEEYFKLQDQYEDYDRRALQIKGWIGAGAIAGIAIGLDDTKSGSGSIWILISILTACFWYLEAKWKVFQYSLADRIRVIEGFFRNEKEPTLDELRPLQIYNWWYKSYLEDKPIYEYEKEHRPKPLIYRIAKAALHDYVMFPYLIIILVCLAMLIANRLQ